MTGNLVLLLENYMNFSAVWKEQFVSLSYNQTLKCIWMVHVVKVLTSEQIE